MAYEFDIIIPKPHWTNEVEGMIEEETEFMIRQQYEEES